MYSERESLVHLLQLPSICMECLGGIMGVLGVFVSVYMVGLLSVVCCDGMNYGTPNGESLQRDIK